MCSVDSGSGSARYRLIKGGNQDSLFTSLGSNEGWEISILNLARNLVQLSALF